MSVSKIIEFFFCFLQASLSNGRHFNFVKRVLTDPYDPRNLYRHVYSFYLSRRNPRWVEWRIFKYFFKISLILWSLFQVSRKLKFRYNVFIRYGSQPTIYPIPTRSQIIYQLRSIHYISIITTSMSTIDIIDLHFSPSTILSATSLIIHIMTTICSCTRKRRKM